MMRTKITALYERLSHEDEQAGESNSISNQKKQLEDYARKNKLPNIQHFTDDGISGTRFDRPGYLDMMEYVKSGGVETVIVKDMSRLGRDHLEVGKAVDEFRVFGVRLIAINDNIDTMKGNTELMLPLLNLMNEHYARDTSRKIKSVFYTKGMSGKHLTGTVSYGYLWDEKRENWVVDPEAAAVVRRIFDMTMAGYGPYQIAESLRKDGIEIPSVHLARHNEGVNKHKKVKDPCGWRSSVIVHILKKREYLGHTVNFKTRKNFRDKKSHYVPESEWTIFENTHEAIIPQELFDNVQRIRANVRRYPDGWGEVAPFTGLMYCADCGAKMYVHRINNGKRVSQYTCSAYSKYPIGSLCATQHRINESVVMNLITAMLRAIMEFSKTDREAFIQTVQEAQAQNLDSDIRKKKSRLAAAKKRYSDVGRMLDKIYEDNVLGKLSDQRYSDLDAKYTAEKDALFAEIRELEQAVTDYGNQQKSAQKFIALVDRYQDFQDLTVTMLNEFVEKILVHERARKGSIETTQEVDIFFNFIGQYAPPHFGEKNMTPEEEEAYRKREERKDRLHQAYLRRVADGTQAKYEAKRKNKVKAKIDARKAAIRAEDIANGVFIPVGDLPKQEPKKPHESKGNA